MIYNSVRLESVRMVGISKSGWRERFLAYKWANTIIYNRKMVRFPNLSVVSGRKFDVVGD